MDALDIGGGNLQRPQVVAQMNQMMQAVVTEGTDPPVEAWRRLADAFSLTS